MILDIDAAFELYERMLVYPPAALDALVMANLQLSKAIHCLEKAEVQAWYNEHKEKETQIVTTATLQRVVESLELHLGAVKRLMPK